MKEGLCHIEQAESRFLPILGHRQAHCFGQSCGGRHAPTRGPNEGKQGKHIGKVAGDRLPLTMHLPSNRRAVAYQRCRLCPQEMTDLAPIDGAHLAILAQPGMACKARDQDGQG